MCVLCSGTVTCIKKKLKIGLKKVEYESLQCAMIIENGQISLCSDTMIDSSVVCSVTMITQGKKHLKKRPMS